MKEMPVWIRAALGGLIFLMMFVACLRVIDPDLGWHLRIGQQILETKSAPHLDNLSWSMAGHEWVDHEWLTNAFMVFLYNHGLWWLTVFIFTFLAFLPFAVWLKRFSGMPETLLIVFLAVLAGSYAAVRPQLISFFFLFALLEILMSKSKVARAAAPLLFLLWANLHAAFIMGLVVLAIFVAITRRDYLVLAASVLATFINPYGAGLYGEIFRVSLSPETARYINEWASPLFVAPGLSLPLGLLFFCCLTLLFGILIFLAVYYRKRYHPALLIATTLLAVGYAKTLKMGPLFFVLAVPFFAAGFDYVRADVKKAHGTIPFQKKMLAAAWTLVALFLVFNYQSKSDNRLASEYPDGAIQFLRQESVQNQVGRLFNEYGWGGYLEWQLPEVKVFIDGRMPHWVARDGSSAMRDYVKVFYPKSKSDWQWQEVFAARQIDTALIRNCEPIKRDCSLQKALEGNSWKVVYKDDAAVVLKK